MQADAAAELDKVKAANKKLESDLSDARKEASAQADATSDVEKKLKEVMFTRLYDFVRSIALSLARSCRHVEKKLQEVFFSVYCYVVIWRL